MIFTQVARHTDGRSSDWIFLQTAGLVRGRPPRTTRKVLELARLSVRVPKIIATQMAGTLALASRTGRYKPITKRGTVSSLVSRL